MLTAVIVGVGKFGFKHAKEWLKHCDKLILVRRDENKLSEIVDQLESEAERIGRKIEIVTYTNLEKAIRDSHHVDYVSIVSPPDLHYDHALQSLELHPKAMLIEKPFVLVYAGNGEDIAREQMFKQINEIFNEAKNTKTFVDEDCQLVFDVAKYKEIVNKHDIFKHVFKIGYSVGPSKLKLSQQLSWEQIWLDIGSHVISIMQEMGFDITSEDITVVKKNDMYSLIKFSTHDKNEQPVDVWIELNKNAERYFGFANNVVNVMWNKDKHCDVLEGVLDDTNHNVQLEVKAPLNQKIHGLIEESKKQFNVDRLEQKQAEIFSRLECLCRIYEALRTI